jgi:hypothetical protein
VRREEREEEENMIPAPEHDNKKINSHKAVTESFTVQFPGEVLRLILRQSSPFLRVVQQRMSRGEVCMELVRVDRTTNPRAET